MRLIYCGNIFEVHVFINSRRKVELEFLINASLILIQFSWCALLQSNSCALEISNRIKLFDPFNGPDFEVQMFYLKCQYLSAHFCRYGSWLIRISTTILGITIEVRNSKVSKSCFINFVDNIQISVNLFQILEEDRGALVCLNHQSVLDAMRE